MEASAAAAPAADRHRSSRLRSRAPRSPRRGSLRWRPALRRGSSALSLRRRLAGIAVVNRGRRVASLTPSSLGSGSAAWASSAEAPGVDRVFHHGQRRIFPNRLDNRLLDDRRLDHRLHRGLGSRDDGDTSRRRPCRRCPGGFFRRRWARRSQRSAGRGRLWLGGRDLGWSFGWQWRDGDCRDRAFRLVA